MSDGTKPRHPSHTHRRPARLSGEVQVALRRLERAISRKGMQAAPRHTAPDGGLIAASYNIHKCIGMDNRFDPGRIADVIAELDADILALQEVDRRFGRRTGLLDMASIATRCGLTLIAAPQHLGGHGWHGNALLVRGATPIRVRPMALPGAEPRGALVVDLAFPHGPLRVVAAHLGLLRRHRVQQTAAILAALADGPAMPTLLLGDFNEWRAGTASALAVLEPRFGPFGPPRPSFPSRLPFLALDRILGHPHGLVQGAHVHDTALARIASDHLPIRARIDLGHVTALEARAAA